MGTRNLTMVINEEGKTKIAQYGQWDGYPEGQGTTALNFLRSCDMKLFKAQLSKLEFFTDEEIESLDDNYAVSMKTYPWLDRDYGACILRAVHEGKYERTDYRGVKTIKEFTVDKLIDKTKFALDSLFCEWAYVIDLQKGTFEVYEGFNRSSLQENERFKYLESEMKEDKEYYPIRLIKEFSLSELPTEKEFQDCFIPEED